MVAVTSLGASAAALGGLRAVQQLLILYVVAACLLLFAALALAAYLRGPVPPVTRTPLLP